MSRNPDSWSRPAASLRRIGGLVAAAVLMVIPAGCAETPSLESELTQVIHESDARLLVLSSLEPVDGDSFLVVCPYESKDAVEDRLGFVWEEAPDYARRDDRQTIAIITGREVTSRAEVGRMYVDFRSGGGKWEVLPIDTPLAVKRSGDAVRISPPGSPTARSD